MHVTLSALLGAGNWDLLLVIVEVALGLGMVIFVHELGHFAVAKWCGVRCEKFYLGFDVYGLRICRFQWGETEYGIGIIPLGGYVKMLGQDDNPSRAAEELERSKIVSEPAQKTSAETKPVYVLDPRSYLAKSVGQRMAIISAGVVMNLIFAFLVAIFAYRLGVKDHPCGISAVTPGEEAWRADLRPGDRIVQIGDQAPSVPLRFRDLMSAVTFGDPEEGVRFLIRREGAEQPFSVRVFPQVSKKETRLRPTIGAESPRVPRLAETFPTEPDTPAEASGKLQAGDQVVAVRGEPVDSYAQLQAKLAVRPHEPLTFTLERKIKSKPSAAPEAAPEATERFDVEVAPRRYKTVGLLMKMGKITAVQDGSPAAQAGLKAGDFVEQINGQSPGDPLSLPQRLERGEFGQEATLTISRPEAEGQAATQSKRVALRAPRWYEAINGERGSPVSAPALGIAYNVLAVVHKAEEGSPAARAEWKTDPAKTAEAVREGDIVASARFKLPDDPKVKERFTKAFSDPIEFGEEQMNWPMFMARLQLVPPGATVQLTLKDGRTTELTPIESADWFNPDRGFNFDAEKITVKAQDWGQAMLMAGRETIESVTQVYSFLRKIGTHISVRGLGGPVTIAKVAGHAAYQGVGELLLFLTMLSANLAVINFLPIPLLDGGHMVFLALEAIFRRPVSEKVVIALHYLGFIFIIVLMLFVLGLDFGLIARFPK